MTNAAIKPYFDKAVNKSHVFRVASECISKIEASGGICCSVEGVKAVIEAMKQIIESNPEEKI